MGKDENPVDLMVPILETATTPTYIFQQLSDGGCNCYGPVFSLLINVAWTQFPGSFLESVKCPNRPGLTNVNIWTESGADLKNGK